MCEEIDACEAYEKRCQSDKCFPIFLRDLPCRGIVKGIMNEVVLSVGQQGTYMKNFLDNIRKGLKKDTNAIAAVKCFPTYVQDLPDGTEEGKFLAVDVGGSNLRVLLVTLTPGEEMAVESMQEEISEDLQTGEGEALFDFIAEKISGFCGEQGVSDDNLPLGLTFSFPVKQVGIRCGFLERWTKGFNATGVIGEDVVKLLKEAIKRREDVKVKIVAILNDTTGTLMACAFENLDCKIGLIVGTGTNGCYVEKQYLAELFDEEDHGSGVVIINLESGAFGDDGALEFCRTRYDREVDKNSINPGKQLHEKMISGMYMGELVRLAAIRLAEIGVLFGGKLSDDFKERGKFETRFVSDIEAEDVCVYDNVKGICEELGITWGTDEDFRDLRYICSCFSKRAAHLSACLIVTLIRKMNYPSISIGIDGTLFKLHPHFKNILNHKIQELLIPETFKFKVLESSDGSGVGAALVAAVAAKFAPDDEEEEGEE